MPASALQIDRASINRANSQHSTGPRTESGKQRSSLNALRHGLTAAAAVLPSEDPAAYQQHCRNFRDEYKPATPTETQLVQELAGTSWRLNRVPLLETALLSEQSPDQSPESAIDALARLGLHSSRLSRQFQKTLDQLRALQSERHRKEGRDLRDAAALLELHKRKGLPWTPSDHGFVFSKEQVERHAERLARQNEAGHIEFARFGSGKFEGETVHLRSTM